MSVTRCDWRGLWGRSHGVSRATRRTPGHGSVTECFVCGTSRIRLTRSATGSVPQDGQVHGRTTCRLRTDLPRMTVRRRPATAVRPAAGTVALGIGALRVRAGRRRPGLLLGALLAGGVAAAASACTGRAGRVGGPDVGVEAQQALLGDRAGRRVLPMASITVAEAQARLHEVAASRARAGRGGGRGARRRPGRSPCCRSTARGSRRASARGGARSTAASTSPAPMHTPEYAAGDGVVLRAGAASGLRAGGLHPARERRRHRLRPHGQDPGEARAVRGGRARRSRCWACAGSRPGRTCTSRCTRAGWTASGSTRCRGCAPAASTSERRRPRAVIAA